VKTIAAILFLLILSNAIFAQAPRKDIPAIAKAANGAVVSIIMSDEDGHPVAQGSGFLVSRDGRIVTNYHVIANGSSAVVKLPGGAFFAVDGVLAFDKARDVAVIKAHGETFRTLTLGNSDRLQVGVEVVAIGNPLSLESTVSNGIISGIRTVEAVGGKFLQITTPISPGSSGGPLFNMAGEVVGITTLYLKGGENLNFAIPINDAKRLLSTESAKPRNLPNESESARTDAPPSTGEVPQAASVARHYYQQLLDAGAFSLWGKNYKGMQPTEDYVCFSDNPRSVMFFTFVARGYDSEWAELYSKWFKLVLDDSSDLQQVEKYYQQMQAIEQTADYPYLRFIHPDDLSNYGSAVQHGTRFLTAHVYEKGVKVTTALFVGVDGEWQDSAPSTEPLSHLSIEPRTMRYVWRLPTGDVGGACEKVDADTARK
jgi:hypothetical protein